MIFIDNVLRTFTDSCLRGKCNPEMDAIMNKFKDKFQPILDEFIKECAMNNIEYCSVNGVLYEELSSMLLSARIQTRLDLLEEGIIIE